MFSSVISKLKIEVRRIRLFQMTFVMVAFSFSLWLTAAGRFEFLVVFAALLGTGYGGFIALSPAVMAEIFGLVGLGSILGTMYTATGIGGLIGPPIAGYLIDTTHSYTPAIVAAMVLGFISFLLLLPIG